MLSVDVICEQNINRILDDISYHIKYFFIGALYVRMNLILILEFKCQNICSISNIIA